MSTAAAPPSEAVARLLAAWRGAVSLVAHFLVGAAKSLFTLRSWWAAGLEMTGGRSDRRRSDLRAGAVPQSLWLTSAASSCPTPTRSSQAPVTMKMNDDIMPMPTT